eukprot:TRINITY_DN14186_c0_g2_i1.p1 TRINITY_DN14186_c0_g2~~TRINITY_DN14186_c0_g2_i1.p1  ORF type:complete len:916 (+),score=214.72 TRINITY_DN14186_c0_g2_i1:75-2822(+)
MAQAHDDSKLRFYKFFQALQISKGLSPTEAAPEALKLAQESSEKTPDFFRGDMSIEAVDKLDPTSAVDLEKAVLAFRDPFFLNKAFLAERPAAEKRKGEAEPDAMDVDTDVRATVDSIPYIDVTRWKAWLEKVEQFTEPPPTDDQGDTSMVERPSYQERMLESLGDLTSALERAFSNKTNNDNGYPEIPPSFLDSAHGLRFLLLILFHPSLTDPDCYNSWHRILRAFRVLTLPQREILATWLADEKNVCVDEFRSILQNLQQLITITFLSEFASDDMPADAQSEPDNIPDHLWDYFVMRTAQKCKNALCCIELFWNANLKRRAAMRRLRKAALTKGAIAVLGEAGGNAAQPTYLKEEEFFNDALNSVERVLQHEFTHAMYFEHIEMESSSAPLQRRPRKPTSLMEIERKSMLNNYTFGLLAHNFCLDAGNKCRFLMFDAASRQREETRQEIMNQVMQGRRVNPYLVLKVRRDNLVQDTLQTLSSLPPAEYRKKLKVVFEGEPGVDEGGVRKEFFQLLVEQLYDPNYAMFNYNSSNKTYWFNPGSFESNLQYELFGALLGMAIYNQVILDIRFPMVVYEKLLAEDAAGTIPVTIDNLVDIQPDLAKSLLGMLEFDGSVEDVYCRNFVASYENFGAVVEVPLKEGGEAIPVTNANCGEYVELYVDWFFNKSIQDKFQSFKRGFLRCMEVEEEKPRRQQGPHADILSMLFGAPSGAENSSAPPARSDEAPNEADSSANQEGGASAAAGATENGQQVPASASASAAPSAVQNSSQSEAKPKRSVNMFLQLFRPVELELLICGSQVLDFKEYKSNADYTDGYEITSPVCVWFWEIALESFNDEQRRDLLAFVSGSDRAPPKGLGAPEARLTISRQSPDSESLPTAHTCFNHLLLPEYSSKEKLEAKLKLAIQFNTGFGMI